MTGFNVRPDDFDACASTFDHTAIDVSGAAGSGRRALEGLGAFWGTNQRGPEFGAAYLDSLDRVFALAETLGPSLEDVGAALRRSAAGYRTADEQGKDGFDRLAP